MKKIIKVTNEKDFYSSEMIHFDKIECLRDSKTPAEVLRTLALDNNWIIRSLVAAHKNTPSDILHQLVHDPDFSVRLNLATSPHITPELEHILAKDSSEFVRSMVAFNTKDQDIMVMLMSDRFDNVLDALCRNQNVTEDIYLRTSALMAQNNLRG